MKKALFAMALLGTMISVAQDMSTKPKLVVGIVVDQMRQDYIHRFKHRFGQDGFNRLIGEGFEYKNAHYNYIPTYTGPGHASIYTGTTPRNHGIIANEWYDKTTGEDMYCAGDDNVTAVGGSGDNGNISARNLLTTTVTDELRLFTNEKAKVVGISIKDRGAALPAGHNPNGAYWYDSKSGHFISSTYYLSELPMWVNAFNSRELHKQYFLENWETLEPIQTYTESLEDNNPYERTLGKRETPTFPYNYNEISSSAKSLLRTTYHGNAIVTEFALAAIGGENLGDDATTDFLAVSYSSTDYAGHAFGPRSIEVQDMYMRLDLEIARLLKHLDETVGEGEYVVFLTSDHGVSDVPSFLEDRKYPGGYFEQGPALEALGGTLVKRYGKKIWSTNVSNNQIFLDRQMIFDSKISLSEFQQFLADQTLMYDWVAEAYTASDLAKRNATDPLTVRIQNGYNTARSGDVIILTKSGFLSQGSTQGTTHGSGYAYDTQIPILFYGKGIPNGNSVREVAITDIAPSVSLMLDIPNPSGATGKPLTELFK